MLINRRPGCGRAQTGVATVEAALVLPLLILFLFGVVEFANAYMVQNDIRSTAQATARYAAVTGGTMAPQAIADVVCVGLDSEEFDEVTIQLSSVDPAASDPPGSRGAIGSVTVETNLQSMTGFFDPSLNISHTIDFVVEQPTDETAAWWGGGTGSCS